MRRMELFAQLYDELTAFPKPTVAACHGSVVGGGAEIAVACDLRVGGSNLRMRFPGAELGVPVGPGAPRQPLRPGDGQVPAPHLAQRQRRRGAANGPGPSGGASCGTEDAALDLAAEVAAHPPEAVARLKQMLHRWDGVVERSADEGRGQVEWQRTGPGLPYATDRPSRGRGSGADSGSVRSNKAGPVHPDVTPGSPIRAFVVPKS